MKPHHAIIAIANIANNLLAWSLRISHIPGMITDANTVIDHLGGTTAVAKLIEAPVSTVHSWRSNGIPKARLAHLRLVSQAIGNPLPTDGGLGGVGLADQHASDDDAVQQGASIIDSAQFDTGVAE